MPVVRMPDGTDVQFPDEMPPEQIRSLIQQKFPNETQQVAPAAPPAEQPFRDQVAPQGMLRGVADVAGLPADLYNLVSTPGIEAGAWIGEQLGIDGQQIRDMAYLPNSYLPTSDRIANTVSEKATEYLGAPEPVDPRTMSGQERLAYEGSRFGAGSLIPAVTLSSKVAPALPPARNLLQRNWQKFTEPYRTTPETAVAIDTAAGVGAGTAMAGYENWIGDSLPAWLDPIARLFLTVVGGGVGATTAKGAINAPGQLKNTGQRVLGLDRETQHPFYNEVDADFFRRSDLNDAAAIVQQQASDPAAAAANIERAQSDMPNYSPLPTSGLLSDDVGLAMTEGRARRSDSKPFVERDVAAGGQVSRNLENMTPIDPATGRAMTGREFTDFGENLQRQRVGEAQADLEDAHREQAEFARERRSQADDLAAYGPMGQQADTAIDQSVEGNLRALQDESNRLYENVDPNGQAVVGVDALVDQAEAVRANLGQLNTPGKIIPQGLLARIERTAPQEDIINPQTGEPTGATQRVPGAEVSIGEMTAVMPELAATERAARKAGNVVLADNIRDLRAGMKNIIAQEAQAGNEAAVRFMDADANYGREGGLGQSFPLGTGDEAGKFRRDYNRDRFNRSTTPPSQTASRFVQPNQPEKAQSLMRAGGQEADVRTKLLSDASRSVIDEDGNINPRRLAAWRDRWGGTLDQFPRVRQEVDDMLTQARAGEDLTGQFADTIRELGWQLDDRTRNVGALRHVLGKDPEHAIKSALNSGDSERAFGELVRLTDGDPTARAGLRAAFVDYMKKNTTLSAVQKTDTPKGQVPNAPGMRPVSWNTLDDTFKRHERAMAQVFSPEEMHSLRQMHRVLRSFKNLEHGATSGSPTAERFADFLRNFEVGAKAYWGILKGGGIVRTMKLALKQFGPKANAVDQILSQMWFDPDLAKHLLRRDTEQGVKQYNKRLLRLLGAGAAGRSLDEEDDDAPVQ